MNTIISNNEYAELLKTKAKRDMKLALLIMSISNLFFIGMMFYIIKFEQANFSEDAVFLLIPIGMFLLISIFILIYIKKIDTKASPHFSYDKYIEYEEEGTKIPLYRVINYGKSSEIVYLLLILNEGEIKIFDIRKKGLVPYLEGNELNTSFKFYFTMKHGMEIMKPKIDIFIQGKKKRVFGIKEINEKLLNYLKAEGYKYEF